ncbi:MAG: histidinol-phosphate transaminase [Clostridium sp.]|uniref:histidinol-phosphate transaminase n=1 Tax=Clostridium sp. TaxID=1506 RepID=UPI003EE67930
MKKVEKYNVESLDGCIILNGNESFYNILGDYKEEILEEVLKIDFNRYPENDSTELRKAYGDYLGIKKENIIAGHGSDEMISLVVSAFINKGKKVLTLNPDFSMYDFYVSQNEGELIKLDCKEDGRYSVEDFINLGKSENVDLVVFSNPNNPTGFAKETLEIEKIIKGFKDKIILVDEAYIEFYKKSVVDKINTYDNLLVTRTLSKAFAGASLRLGFLIGNEKLIEKIQSFKVPYNVNRVSQSLGKILISKKDRVNNFIEEVLEERERVFKELKEIEEKSKKIKVYKSNSNFIFGRGNKSFLEELEKEKIVVRNFKDDSFRISIGSKEENNSVIKILKEWSKL